MGFWSSPKREAGTESPSGRGGHGSVSIAANKLLIFGGADRTPQGFNDLWVLEIVDGHEHWTRVSPKLGAGQKQPIPRSGCSLTLVNGKVYIFGGQEPISGAILEELLELDVATWELHTVAVQKGAPARHSHAAGIFEKHSIIVFGGAGLRGPMNDVWTFNTQTLAWSCLSEGLDQEACLEPREMAAGVAISDAGLFIHGGRGAEGEILSDVGIFDGRAGKWVLIQTTPYARCAHTATNAVQQQQQAHISSPAEAQQQPSSSSGAGASAGSNATPPVASNVLLYGGFTGEAVSRELLQLSFMRQSHSAGGASLKVELRPVRNMPPREGSTALASILLANPPPRFAHSAAVLQRGDSVEIAIFGGVNQTDDLHDVIIWTL